MNIQGWNFDFESLPYWPDEKDSYQFTHELYENEQSDLACVLYSILENTMCNYLGCLAILRKKEDPCLDLVIHSFLVPWHQVSFSSNGNQIFLQVSIHNRSRSRYVRPLLVLDLAQNRFSYVRENLYSVSYRIEEVTPDLFFLVIGDPQSSSKQEIVFSKEAIDFDTLAWFPMKEIESLSDKYFGTEGSLLSRYLTRKVAPLSRYLSRKRRLLSIYFTRKRSLLATYFAEKVH